MTTDTEDMLWVFVLAGNARVLRYSDDGTPTFEVWSWSTSHRFNAKLWRRRALARS